ncbi:MAG: MTH938/NDUFAF3 family protein [Anaerolineaceae bacterium]
MFTDSKGPITHFEWARFTINGAVHGPDKGVGKDIFLCKEGVSAWHERKGHKLKPGMLTRALKIRPEVLLIGTGVEGALEIGKKARNAASSAGVQMVAMRTPQACQEYNRLFHLGKKVVLLAHGTC